MMKWKIPTSGISSRLFEVLNNWISAVARERTPISELRQMFLKFMLIFIPTDS